jgi:malonyl-CoA O-methyltransferase
MLMPASSLKMLRDRFDRRAVLMQNLDVLFTEVSERMLSRLDYIKHEPRLMVDMGCGTGRDLQRLLDIYPKATCLGLDFSAKRLEPLAKALSEHNVLQRLSRRWKQWLGATQPLWAVQADMHASPLKPGSVDLLWSNLALHWSEKPDHVFREWFNSLAHGGLLMFSAFGPDTLMELRNAARSLEPQPDVMSFVDMHDFGDMLLHAGYSTPVMDMERITLTYDSARALLRDVQSLGGGNMSSTGLRGRTWHTHLLAALDTVALKRGEHALTFEIIYGHAWRIDRPGQVLTNEHGEQHAVIPVSAIGRRHKKDELS